MATATQTAPSAVPNPSSSDHHFTPTERLAAGMLSHAHAAYSFAFTPFLQSTYHHGLPADRPICKAYSAGHCPLGSRCPERHVSAPAPSGGREGGREPGGFNSLVCKHWLRGLCKKGEGCEFLHEYNLRKMPECNFFLRNGYCSNGDECLYLHIDPRSKLPPCPDYDNRGFCALGPTCPKKHVRRTLCPYYLAGFCPEGRNCKDGAHPHWSPVAVVVPLPPVDESGAAGTPTTGAGFGMDDEMGNMGTPDEYNPHHVDSEDDRGSQPHQHRGGFKGRGGGVGGGGRWRGRGGGHKFRGRNY